jgi:predicted outer membrane repeat protein
MARNIVAFVNMLVVPTSVQLSSTVSVTSASKASVHPAFQQWPRREHASAPAANLHTVAQILHEDEHGLAGRLARRTTRTREENFPGPKTDFNVKEAWQRRAKHRQLQEAVGDDGLPDSFQPYAISSAVCEDTFATNTGHATSCAYDCQDLQEKCFPGEESRCFLFDASTGMWPEALLSMRQNKTITIPNDDNWIVQGLLDKGGVPVRLDARMSSGSARNGSQASIVVRCVRFSGQTAPVDVEHAFRSDLTQAYTAHPAFANGLPLLGGAFKYDGGGLDPTARWPKLVFDHAVFDHNEAVSGGAVFISGREDMLSALDVTYESCLFFRNSADIFSGALWQTGLGPSNVMVNNTHFIHNQAIPGAPHASWGDSDNKPGMSGKQHMWSILNTHVEGPDYAMVSGGLDIDVGSGYPNLQPDGSIHNMSFERLTIANVGGDSIPGFAGGGGNGGVRKVHAKFMQCTFRQLRGTNNSQAAALLETHSVVLEYLAPTSLEVSQQEIADSGAPSTDSRGEGVLAFMEQDWARGGTPSHYRVTDSRFLRNRAARGAAILMQSALGSTLDVVRSFFAQNVATVSGGAILVLGIATVRIFDSVMQENGVVPAPWSDHAYFTVQVYTGSTGSGARASPLWSVDGGAVRGASQANCTNARNASTLGLQRGLSPSWPGNAPCVDTNDTIYSSQMLYSEVVELQKGPHTLRVGLLSKDEQLTTSWFGGGWIDVLGLVRQTYPRFEDDRRTIRYPGCWNGGGTDHDCPGGEAFWIEIPMHVGVGEGGAIMTEDRCTLRLTNMQFAQNFASQGSSLSSVAALSVNIRNTSYAAMAGDMSTVVHTSGGSIIGNCYENPCKTGSKCTFPSPYYSTFCEVCEPNEVGNGVSCTACIGGKEPNGVQTECVPCPAGKQSLIGQCTTCPAGKFGAEGVCNTCPEHQEPTQAATRCQCKAGFYSPTHGASWKAKHIMCVERSNTHKICGAGQHVAVECEECPGCVSCNGGIALIEPGFGLSKKDAQLYRSGLNAVSWVAQAVYECPVGLMCKGETLKTSNASSDFRREMNCREGHDPASPMCAVCLPDWIKGEKKLCEPCKDKYPTLSDFVKLFVLVIAIVLGVLCVKYVAKNVQETAKQSQKDEYGTEVVIVGTVAAVAPFYVYLKVVVRSNLSQST